ncbi:MAG: hypothetical protein OEZ02_08405 [Anaerolineae bacterium]|nr:hypothetical protein [Anaerolineae bacterium]
MDTKTPQELNQAGKSAYQSGDYLAAAQAFEAAAAGFSAQGLPLDAAEMANNQSVSLLQAGEAQAALDALAGSEAAFASAGDIHRQAMAIGNQAAALDALGQLPEAEAAYLRSAELLQQSGDEQLRANVIQSISRVQMRSGRQLEALATMQAGLDSIEKPSLRQRMLKKLLKAPFKLLNRS